MSKTTSRRAAGAMMVASLSLAIPFVHSALAEGPLPSATSTSALPSASASAAPSASVKAPPAPAFTSLPKRVVETTIASFPDIKSDKPKPEEWASAEPLALTRAPSSCKATRVREWVRVACYAKMSVDVFGARVVGGSDEDVEIGDLPVIKKARYEEQRGLRVTFPVRRGEQRIITLDSVTFQWKAYSPDEDVFQVLQVSWPEAQKGPTLVVQ